MALSERPLLALPARRAIIEWADRRERFADEQSFALASELAARFRRARSQDKVADPLQPRSAQRSR
jgi:hypothetical protein